MRKINPKKVAEKQAKVRASSMLCPKCGHGVVVAKKNHTSGETVQTCQTCHTTFKTTRF